MKKCLITLMVCAVIFIMCSAESCLGTPSSDDIQRNQQEKILAEETRQVGMPNIVNFRERKLMKDIIELRDQMNFATYTYYFNAFTGKIGDKVCDSVGYPIPGATQFTNPQKIEWAGGETNALVTLPQADPNGLFSPASEDATWVMCKNPNGPDIKAVYVEPKVICSPWKLK